VVFLAVYFLTQYGLEAQTRAHMAASFPLPTAIDLIVGFRFKFVLLSVYSESLLDLL
jgi:hypothetical protein